MIPDMILDILLPEEGLTAQRTGPVLALDVPYAVHDKCITVPVGGLALLAGMGPSRGLGTGAPQLLESCPPDGLQ